MSSVEGEFNSNINPGRLGRKTSSALETACICAVWTMMSTNELCDERKLAITFWDVCLCAESRRLGRTKNSFADGAWHGSSPLVRSSRCLSLTSPNGCLGMRDSECELGWQEAVRSDVRIALRMAESVAARNWAELIATGGCVSEWTVELRSLILWGEDDGGKSMAGSCCAGLLKRGWKYQICWT